MASPGGNRGPHRPFPVRISPRDLGGAPPVARSRGRDRVAACDFGPEPVQFFGDIVPPQTGARGLVFAVLSDGIRCLLAPRGRHAGKARREAERWVLAMGSRPFQWAWCCDALGLDASALGQGVLARARERAWDAPGTGRSR